MFGLKENEYRELIKILKEQNIKKTILFGSRAKGNYKNGSDIDLAIIGDEKKLSLLLNEETNLPYFFDIVNLEKLTNQNLINHIQRVGKDLI